MRLRCRIPLAHFELDVDATFDARVTAIFGPSGSGKTTLLDAIAGLRPVAEGEIEMNGRMLFSSARGIDVSPRQRDLGYVPQEGALFPHLSVRRNILFGAGREAAAGPAATITVDHVIEVLEIEHLMSRPVTKLSGGEGQRVALARAILSRPKLLLLDEPLAALDVGLKERILPYLERVRDEFAIPMIYVTHNLTEVLTLADWVLVLREGTLLGQGPPKATLGSVNTLLQLKDQFENVFKVKLVESNSAAGNSRVQLQSGNEIWIPHVSAPAANLQISVSAEDILIATEEPRGISAANVLRGSIQKIESRDGEAILTVLAGEEFVVRLTVAAVSRLRLQANTPVFLVIKTRSFRTM
jgi:molybdate transport system ATP-binding protein